MSQALFAEFSAQSKEQWLAQLTKDLKLDDASHLLTQAVCPDLAMPIMATSQDALPDYLPAFHDFIASRKQPGWQYRQFIYAGQLDLLAEAFANGANGSTLITNGALDEASLQRLDLKQHHAAIFYISQSTAQVVEAIGRAYSSTQSLQASIYQLPGEEGITAWATSTAQAIAAAKPAPRLKLAGIDGAYYHNQGATPAQELAAALLQLHALIEAGKARGLSADQIFATTEINLACGTSYLVDLAKMRALRLLVLQLGQQHGLQGAWVQAGMTSSARTFSSADADTNLLRHTTAALAAASGTADFICLLPHTSLNPAFAARMSRNISHLLRHEVHADAVADPAAGSYYIEQLTVALAEKAWQYLHSWSAIPDFQEERAALSEAYSAGKLIMIGSNKYRHESSERGQYPNLGYAYFNLEEQAELAKAEA